MNFNEVQELINLVNKSSLAEFKLKDKDFEIQIRTKKYYKGSNAISVPPVQSFVPSYPTTPIAPETSIKPVSASPSSKDINDSETPVTSNKSVVEIKSPIVGTFYRSSSPDKPAYVKVGDQVKQGDIVCIIEAMKLFNEIESDATGTVVKVLVEDASPVEYDQVLFLVEI